MTTATEVIAAQSARAEAYAGSAETDMRAAISAATAIALGNTKPDIIWAPTDVTADVSTVDQVVSAKYVDPTSKPGTPGPFQGIDAVTALRLPDPYVVNTDGLFDEVVPTITTAPFTDARPAIDFAKIDAMLDAITVPDILTIVPPTLHDVLIDLPPTVTIPTFDKTFTFATPDTLSGVPEAFVARYETVLPEMKAFVDDGVARWEAAYAPGYNDALAALEAKLQDGIDRGTALPIDFETALYTRGRSKIESDFTRTTKDIESGMKKRGFDMPPGALFSSIANANVETGHALARQATELTIERAKMEIQHIQFVLGQSASIRQWMNQSFVQYAGVIAQINQQANEHAKYFAQFMIDQFTAVYHAYAAQIELYKTEAVLYEARLKAAMATLDIYRLELEAAKLTTEVDSLQVEMYSKRIAAEMSKIEIYVQRMKAVATRADVEKDKVEIFAEEVKAYVAQLTAEELKTKVYLAALQGDEAKLKGELAKLEAYSKTVDAEVARAKGDIAIQELRVEGNKLLVDIYRAELSGYQAEIQGNVAAFEGDIKAQMAMIDAYKTNKQIEMEVIKTKLGRDALTLQYATDEAKLKEAAITRDLTIFGRHVEVLANITKDVGSLYANMAASALASQNTMISEATSV